MSFFLYTMQILSTFCDYFYNVTHHHLRYCFVLCFKCQRWITSLFSSPNPSRGVHVAEKAHGRSRSSHLKYQRWLVDLMLFRYCLSSTERRTGLRKIGMKKTSPMRLLEWTGMDAEISNIWNFRRRAKINLKFTHKPFLYVLLY
jgi:hypothetical protein